MLIEEALQVAAEALGDRAQQVRALGGNAEAAAGYTEAAHLIRIFSGSWSRFMRDSGAEEEYRSSERARAARQAERERQARERQS